MYTNQFTPKYLQYNQQYHHYPPNDYQMYNYNQQSVHNISPFTQIAETFNSNVPVQQLQVSSLTHGKNVTSLWMGNLEHYMTESFITRAFQKMGEYPENIKLMRNTNTGENAGYAFVDFYDSVFVMKKLNGKYIPRTNPPVIFKLNRARNPEKITSKNKDFSVWLSELNSDVDDFQLYKTFACRYQSIRIAKVVLDSDGNSKGYGFISFGSKGEQKHFLNNINGFLVIGSKRTKVSSVIPKSERHIVVVLNDSKGYNASQDYGQYYETNYWQRYSIWNQPLSQNCVLKQAPAIEHTVIKTNGNLNLVDYKKSIYIDALNKDIVTQDYNLWDALESSKWLPLDTTGVI